MEKIEKIIGTCDGVPIIFEKNKNDEWSVNVPADLKDGSYIVEIIVYKNGISFYKTAVLYMCDAKCVLAEFSEPIFLKLENEHIKVEDSREIFVEEQKRFDIELAPEKVKSIFVSAGRVYQ